MRVLGLRLIDEVKRAVRRLCVLFGCICFGAEFVVFSPMIMASLVKEE